VDEAPGGSPELITPVTPGYPPALRILGRSGRVVVEFTVGADGVPDPASLVVVASDDPRFEASVRVAVLEERFTPGRRGGGPVAVRVRQGFDFSVR
jgi:TonB family protein